MPSTSNLLSPEFFINPRCPPGDVPAEATSIDVRLGEMTNVPEREAPTVVLETENSKVGKHLSVSEVGPDNELIFFAYQGE